MTNRKKIDFFGDEQFIIFILLFSPTSMRLDDGRKEVNLIKIKNKSFEIKTEEKIADDLET